VGACVYVCVFLGFVMCGCFGNVCCTLTVVFLTLTDVFPCFIFSCKANAGVKLAKTGHGLHSSNEL